MREQHGGHRTRRASAGDGGAAAGSEGEEEEEGKSEEDGEGEGDRRGEEAATGELQTQCGQEAEEKRSTEGPVGGEEEEKK